MKKKKYIVAMAMAIMSLSVQAQKTLTVLHTNDTHSTVLPLNENLEDTLRAGRGGYIRRIAMLKEERKKDKDLLLFDSGDFSQGSPFYTLFKGDVEVGLMNLMGYDAATIGNHEFDFGLENMARLFKMAKFPIVCANYDFTGTCLEGLVKPYIILKRKGIKIGVFGICPKMEGLVAADNYKGVKYLDPVEKTHEMGEYLKNTEKCDVVICLSHMGWNIKPDVDDEQIISGSHGIDLVLGGHSHTYFKDLQWVKDSEGKLVPDDQNGKHAIYVGKMMLTIQNKK